MVSNWHLNLIFLTETRALFLSRSAKLRQLDSLNQNRKCILLLVYLGFSLNINWCSWKLAAAFDCGGATADLQVQCRKASGIFLVWQKPVTETKNRLPVTSSNFRQQCRKLSPIKRESGKDEVKKKVHGAGSRNSSGLVD
jgi:hypothetical protein